jgi:hypothetical protein
MVVIRKIITMRETIFSEVGCGAAIGCVCRRHGGDRHPFAARFANDLRPLFVAGAMLGGPAIS